MRKVIVIIFGLLIILLFFSCDGESPTQPSDNITESKELKEFMNNVIFALKNNDADSFISYFPEKNAKYYSKAIIENKTKLADFAKILENRKLIASDSLYAVYEVTYNGMTFEISMFLDEDGKWKLKDM